MSNWRSKLSVRWTLIFLFACLWWVTGSLLVLTVGLCTLALYCGTFSKRTWRWWLIFTLASLSVAVSAAWQLGAWLGNGEVFGLAGSVSSIGLLFLTGTVQVPWKKALVWLEPATWMVTVLCIADVFLAPLVGDSLFLFERPSVATVLLGTLLVVHVYRLWEKEQSQVGIGRWWTLGTVAFLVLALVVLSMSLVWLGVVLSLCGVLLFVVTTWDRRVVLGVWLPVFIVCYVLAFFLLVISVPSLHRAVEVTPTYTDATSVLWETWRQDVPGFGSGAGTYAQVMARFGDVPEGQGAPIAYSSGPNGWVTLGTEFGPLAVLAVVLVMYSVLESLRRRRLERGDELTPVLVVAWLALTIQLAILPGHTVLYFAWIVLSMGILESKRNNFAVSTRAPKLFYSLLLIMVALHVGGQLGWVPGVSGTAINRQLQGVEHAMVVPTSGEVDTGLVNEALLLVRYQTRLHPNSVPVALRQACLYRLLIGLVPDAEMYAAQAVDRARALAPARPDVVYESGVIALQSALFGGEDMRSVQRQRAWFFSEQLLALQNVWAPAYVFGADVAATFGDKEAARTYLATAYALAPDDRMLAQLVRWSVDLGHKQDALQLLERLLQTYPFDTDLRAYYETIQVSE